MKFLICVLWAALLFINKAHGLSFGDLIENKKGVWLSGSFQQDKSFRPRVNADEKRQNLQLRSQLSFSIGAFEPYVLVSYEFHKLQQDYRSNTSTTDDIRSSWGAGVGLIWNFHISGKKDPKSTFVPYGVIEALYKNIAEEEFINSVNEKGAFYVGAGAGAKYFLSSSCALDAQLGYQKAFYALGSESRQEEFEKMSAFWSRLGFVFYL